MWRMVIEINYWYMHEIFINVLILRVNHCTKILPYIYLYDFALLWDYDHCMGDSTYLYDFALLWDYDHCMEILHTYTCMISPYFEITIIVWRFYIPVWFRLTMRLRSLYGDSTYIYLYDFALLWDVDHCMEILPYIYLISTIYDHCMEILLTYTCMISPYFEITIIVWRFYIPVWFRLTMRLRSLYGDSTYIYLYDFALLWDNDHCMEILHTCMISPYYEITIIVWRFYIHIPVWLRLTMRCGSLYGDSTLHIPVWFRLTMRLRSLYGDSTYIYLYDFALLWDLDHCMEILPYIYLYDFALLWDYDHCMEILPYIYLYDFALLLRCESLHEDSNLCIPVWFSLTFRFGSLYEDSTYIYLYDFALLWDLDHWMKILP